MRNRRVCVFMCVGLVWVFGIAAEANEDESKVKTILVDCDKGDSINKALEEKADELIIEIRGMCRENVTISRDWVTFRGHDPEVDGIESQTDDTFAGGLTPAVVAWSANGVVLENLTLRGGMSTIGDLYYAPTDVAFAISHWEFYRVTNCVLEGGEVNLSVRDGNLTLTDVTVRGSRMYGIYLSRGRVQCLRCNVETGAVSFGAGVSLNEFSRGDFEDSTIAASGETSAFEMYVSSRAWLTNSQITAEKNALVASIGSHLGVANSVFSGSLRVEQKSELRLFSSTQTANPSKNVVTLDSILETYDGTSPSTLVGPLSMYTFGKAVLRGNTTVDGELTCIMGGDAVADPTVSITGAVSGCDHLSAP